MIDVLETPWADAIQLEMKVAEIIKDQANHGWVLDKELCEKHIKELNEYLEDTDRQILPFTKPRIIRGSEISEPFTKSGRLRVNVSNYFGALAPCVGGPVSKVEFEQINLGSTEQVKEYLFSIGWAPDEFNYNKVTKKRTSPKLTTTSLLKLGKVGELLDHRTVLTHRRNQLQGFLANVRPDGKIEARANSLGTNTCRMTHSIVVNVPKAKEQVFFGKQMRSVFTVPDGYDLMGGDAAGLENRMIVHFLNNPAVIPIFTEGDFHVTFWKAIERFCTTRDQAKNIEYAYFFGAKDWKLGAMADIVPPGFKKEDVGAAIRLAINDKVPGLDDYIQRVKLFSKCGYVIGLDGRKLRTRGEHSAFNTLIQGSGAIFMKRVLVILDDWIKRMNLDAHFVGNFHDEFQLEIREGQSHVVKLLFEQAIKSAALYYKLNCPMVGEVKVGKRWSETH
ncbi:MAG: DNA polymerase [Nitrosopumilaceae archaeon]